MAGYLIAELEITDQALFDEFAVGIAKLVENHNGRYWARGGTTEFVEGDWTPHRIVVIEFESFEKVKAFVGSAEYKTLAELRSRSSTASTIITEGV